MDRIGTPLGLVCNLPTLFCSCISHPGSDSFCKICSEKNTKKTMTRNNGELMVVSPVCVMLLAVQIDLLNGYCHGAPMTRAMTRASEP